MLSYRLINHDNNLLINSLIDILSTRQLILKKLCQLHDVSKYIHISHYAKTNHGINSYRKY